MKKRILSLLAVLAFFSVSSMVAQSTETRQIKEPGKTVFNPHHPRGHTAFSRLPIMIPRTNLQ